MLLNFYVLLDLQHLIIVIIFFIILFIVFQKILFNNFFNKTALFN